MITNLQFLNIEGETILPITLFGDNRNIEVTEWHRRVMTDHFKIPVNYVKCPFPNVSHGYCMNEILRQTVDMPNAPDYYWFIDNDCIMLREESFKIAFKQVSDKMTIWGHAWNSSHKISPNYTVFHPYASQACLIFSRKIYNELGRPDMDHHNSRSDTAEELTYAAKSAGYNVCLLYPSFSVVLDTPLDHSLRAYGMGNTYGPLRRPLWHHTSSTTHPRHVEVFIETCRAVINGSFDRENPSKPYEYRN